MHGFEVRCWLIIMHQFHILLTLSTLLLEWIWEQCGNLFGEVLVICCRQKFHKFEIHGTWGLGLAARINSGCSVGIFHVHPRFHTLGWPWTIPAISVSGRVSICVAGIYLYVVHVWLREAVIYGFSWWAAWYPDIRNYMRIPRYKLQINVLPLTSLLLYVPAKWRHSNPGAMLAGIFMLCVAVFLSSPRNMLFLRLHLLLCCVLPCLWPASEKNSELVL